MKDILNKELELSGLKNLSKTNKDVENKQIIPIFLLLQELSKMVEKNTKEFCTNNI